MVKWLTHLAGSGKKLKQSVSLKDTVHKFPLHNWWTKQWCVCSQWKSLERAKTLNTVKDEQFYLCGGLRKISDHKFYRTMSCKKLFFDLPVAFVTYFILCKKIFWIINTIPFRTMCHPSVCKEYRHCVVKWEHCSSNILLSKMANYPNTSLQTWKADNNSLTWLREKWPL